MMRVLLWLLAVAATAAVTHIAIVRATPTTVMSRAMDGLAARAGGINKPLSTPPATAKSRAIVKPSPDLAYTSCVFDVANGPVLVAGSPSAAYWSIGLYAGNTDNFHVVTPKSAVNGMATVVLARASDKAAAEAAHKGATVIVPPSTRGVALFRYLVLDADGLADARRAQATAQCKAIKDSP